MNDGLYHIYFNTEKEELSHSVAQLANNRWYLMGSKTSYAIGETSRLFRIGNEVIDPTSDRSKLSDRYFCKDGEIT